MMATMATDMPKPTNIALNIKQNVRNAIVNDERQEDKIQNKQSMPISKMCNNQRRTKFKIKLK